MSSDLTLPGNEKPKPPPIPTSPEPIHKPNRKSFRKTLEGLIPVTPKTPKYPEGQFPGSLTSPASIEKGPIKKLRRPVVRKSFVPLEVPNWKNGGHGMKLRTLIGLWALGCAVILGLCLGLGLGLGLKGVQGSSSAAVVPTTSSVVAPTSTRLTEMTTAASTSTTATAYPVTATARDQAGHVLKVQKFAQPAFVVPANAPTTTYTVAASTATAGIGVIDCPASNGTTYTSGGKQFSKLCYTDLPGPGVLNLNQIIVNSLERCIDACVKYSGSNGACGAVSYYADMTQIVPQQQANCWLKDSSGAPQPGVWDQASAVIS